MDHFCPPIHVLISDQPSIRRFIRDKLQVDLRETNGARRLNTPESEQVIFRQCTSREVARSSQFRLISPMTKRRSCSSSPRSSVNTHVKASESSRRGTVFTRLVYIFAHSLTLYFHEGGEFGAAGKTFAVQLVRNRRQNWRPGPRERSHHAAVRQGELVRSFVRLFVRFGGSIHNRGSRLLPLRFVPRRTATVCV